MSYFPTANPWQQLAVIGEQIGRNLSGAMFQQPQIRFQNELALKQLADQAALQQWQMQQGNARLQIAEAEEARRRLLDQASLKAMTQQQALAEQKAREDAIMNAWHRDMGKSELQLKQEELQRRGLLDQATIGHLSLQDQLARQTAEQQQQVVARNLAMAGKVQEALAPSKDVMDYMPAVLGGGLEARQADQRRQLMSLGAQQAFGAGQGGSFVTALDKSDDLEKWRAMQNILGQQRIGVQQQQADIRQQQIASQSELARIKLHQYDQLLTSRQYNTHLDALRGKMQIAWSNMQRAEQSGDKVALSNAQKEMDMLSQEFDQIARQTTGQPAAAPAIRRYNPATQTFE